MTTSLSQDYDVFLSYKTRKFLPLASWLYERLGRAGYRVWFDRRVLEQKEITGHEYTKKELIDLLTQAVARARCSVILEAELELVLLPPGMTRKYALTNMLAMENSNGTLINWNWQKVEIDSSERFVGVYYSGHQVIAHNMAGTVNAEHEFTDDKTLFGAICACLRVLSI